MLAVRSPTLSGGYWNNSPLTFLSSRAGYWLTGDTVFQADDGEFVQLDRQVDTIRSTRGPVYTLPLEERVLLSSDDILDCTVVAAPGKSGAEVPVCGLRLKESSQAAAEVWLRELNQSLRRNGFSELAGVWIARSPNEFPLGATGKVLKREVKQRLTELLASRAAAHTPELGV